MTTEMATAGIRTSRLYFEDLLRSPSPLQPAQLNKCGHFWGSLGSPSLGDSHGHMPQDIVALFHACMSSLPVHALALEDKVNVLYILSLVYLLTHSFTH